MLLTALTVLALTLVPSSFGIVQLDSRTTGRLPDFDARAKIAPTPAQLTAAKSIQGRIAWNSYGTPGSIFKDGGYIATGIKAPGAAAAARSWIASHAKLFRLESAQSLRVATAAPLRGAPNVHAVTFRQTFGGVLSADGRRHGHGGASARRLERRLRLVVADARPRPDRQARAHADGGLGEGCRRRRALDLEDAGDAVREALERIDPGGRDRLQRQRNGATGRVRHVAARCTACVRHDGHEDDRRRRRARIA